MFGLHWKTLPASTVILFLIVCAGFALLIPQLVAIALTAPHLFTSDTAGVDGEGTAGEARLHPFRIIALWLRSDPTVITGGSSAQAHWAAVLVTVVLMIGVAVATVIMLNARRKDPQRKKGLAPRADVLAQLGTVQLVRDRAPQLRPSLAGYDVPPEWVGYRVGVYLGLDLWLRIEDPTIIVGPSRSGKGLFLVLHWILSAPGAVVTTSSKMDNFIYTMRERLRRHPGSKALIFAPGVAGGDAFGQVLRWDPIPGCVDEETLVRRIHGLIPGDSFSGSTSNGGHWDTLGQQLASHLFHAAACMKADVDKIWEWVGSPQRAVEAVAAIRNHPNGLLEAATHLESVINMPAEQRAAQWGVLPTVLAFLGSSLSRQWMKPLPGEEIDLVDFILSRSTLYLVGDKASTGGYKRIIDGLLAEIDYVSKGLADASPGARLDPPLSYILDEAGNFEYSGLYELITAGGGRGRIALVVFQSREQLMQWGAEVAKTLWDAAVAKIVLPGGGDSDELEKISRLIGDLWSDRRSHTYGSGSPSVSVSEEKRAILEPREIREMIGGYGLLFYRNLKPVIAKLTPFTDHPAYSACDDDARELAEIARKRSPFATKLLEYTHMTERDVRDAKSRPRARRPRSRRRTGR